MPIGILLSIHPDYVVISDRQVLSRVYLEAPGDTADVRDAAEPEVLAPETPLSDAEERRRNILTHFDLHPVSDSYAAGYIIGGKFPEESARSSGVGPGDILVSVNGYPVGEPSSDYLAWVSFQTTQKATVVISRGGQQIMLHYPEDVVVNRSETAQQN